MLLTIVVGCNKDKDDPKPDDSNNNSSTPSLPAGRSVTLFYMKYFTMAGEDPVNNNMVVTYLNLGSGYNVGDYTVNGLLYQYREFIPGTGFYQYETDDPNNYLDDSTWAVGKSITWNAAGGASLPAFNVTNNRWPTTDFKTSLRAEGTLSVSNGINIALNKTVTADYLAISIGYYDSNFQQQKVLYNVANFSGNVISIPASLTSVLANKEIAIALTVYAYDASSQIPYVGSSLTAINAITHTYYDIMGI